MGLCAAACDLQPRIMSLPDSVGDFISARYPALLADPDAQPEIYNSAASDYGVYASPELYGTAPADDYVLYASVDDYIVPPDAAPNQAAAQPVANEDTAAADASGQTYTYHAPDEGATPSAPFEAVDDYLRVPMYGGGARPAQITVARGDTLYSIARKYDMKPADLAAMNNLSEPFTLSVGQRLRISAPAEQTVSPDKNLKPATPQKKLPAIQAAPSRATTTRVDLTEITVAPGETLYSISRKYSVPVNDLAVMNNLTAPFSLSVGQRLRVPDLSDAPVRAAAKSTTTVPAAKSPAKPAPKTAAPSVKNAPPAQVAPAPRKPAQKISSDPKKKLPKISARSSSKFSWPVRGKILSAYGAKSSGLFNDGINIAAARGAAVGAAENGVVAYAGNEVKGMGNLIIIQHSDGWMTVYAHMDSMTVRRGARVSVGQKIGSVGATGKVDRPQLHFEIRKGTKAYNPASYLKK